MGAKFDNNSGGSANWYDVEVEADSDLGPFIVITIENPAGGPVLELVSDDDSELDHFFSMVEKAKYRLAELKAQQNGG